MIRGVHGLLFSSDAEATRAFIRDKLRLPFTDTGGGWLIFDFREGDLGVHPIDESGEPAAGTHQLSLYCDDIRGTVAELKTRGVRFDRKIREQEWGFETVFNLPGGVKVQLFEPKYRKASAARARPRPRRVRRR